MLDDRHNVRLTGSFCYTLSYTECPSAYTFEDDVSGLALCQLLLALLLLPRVRRLLFFGKFRPACGGVRHGR